MTEYASMSAVTSLTSSRSFYNIMLESDNEMLSSCYPLASAEVTEDGTLVHTRNLTIKSEQSTVERVDKLDYIIKVRWLSGFIFQLSGHIRTIYFSHPGDLIHPVASNSETVKSVSPDYSWLSRFSWMWSCKWIIDKLYNMTSYSWFSNTLLRWEVAISLLQWWQCHSFNDHSLILRMTVELVGLSVSPASPHNVSAGEVDRFVEYP